MKIAHLTTVDASLRYLILPQLLAASEVGESHAISSPGPHVAEIERMGIVHHALSSSTRGVSARDDLKAMVELWRILGEIRPDVLHTHNPKPGVYGRIIGRLRRVPIVINTVHGLYATESDTAMKRSVVYGLEFVASLFSDMELVQSAEDVATMRRWKIGLRSSVVHLGNGVDLERFRNPDPERSRQEVRRALGFDPQAVIVGCVARLVKEKGIIDLIEAWRARRTDYTLMIAGPWDPTKADSIGEDVVNRAREEGVVFLGHRDDVDELYKAWDLFVLPSYREGFPRSAMEAATSGLPVIATNIRGCRDVVEHSRNGLLVPPGSPDSLGEAIDTLVIDADRREAMGAHSAAKAIEEFDESTIVARVMRSYREVARKKGLDDLTRALEAPL